MSHQYKCYWMEKNTPRKGNLSSRYARKHQQKSEQIRGSGIKIGTASSTVGALRAYANMKPHHIMQNLYARKWKHFGSPHPHR